MLLVFFPCEFLNRHLDRVKSSFTLYYLHPWPDHIFQGLYLLALQQPVHNYPICTCAYIMCSMKNNFTLNPYTIVSFVLAIFSYLFIFVSDFVKWCTSHVTTEIVSSNNFCSGSEMLKLSNWHPPSLQFHREHN